MLLTPCTHSWGGSDLLTDPATVEAYDDVVFVPLRKDLFFFADPAWGVYGRDGQLIEQAALRHGADNALVGQSLQNPEVSQVSERAPDGDYMYGGVFSGHYGQLICSLSRLWGLSEVKSEHLKVVFHSHQTLDEMLRLPYVRICFDRLGLNESNIVLLDQPTIIPRLQIPAAGFAEQNYVRDVYREVCHRIGAAFSDAPGSERRGPAYVTKTGLTSGVGRVENEQVIENIMRRNGVEIIRPETLTFEAQVNLFSQDRTIAGTVGSALHTSIFSPPRGNLITLSGFNSLNSNIIMMDRVSGTRAQHVYSEAGVQMRPNAEVFQGLVTIAEPDQVGRELC